MRTPDFGCRLMLLLAFTCVTVDSNVYFPASKPTGEWWTNSIIYQVYPRSFKDSDNDGVGDLRGIIQKLDYFVDLGVDILWIGPIFKSPMDDMGYDVEDSKQIDPVFGTMDDFIELVSEMDKRNLKLMTDLIPNHSSYKCEWFQKSIKREGKYSNYYLWKNASNQNDVIQKSAKPLPPNNWLSVFGGSGWTWNDDRKQFYFHQFNTKQPEFNIRNLDVQNELYEILEFWLDKGITGFRFDAVRHLFESESFEDEPYLPGKENSANYDDMNHTLILDQPENIDIIYKWREFFENYKKKKNLLFTPLMSTESYTDFKILMQYYGNSTHSGAQIPFNFGLLAAKRSNMVESIDKYIDNWLSIMPNNEVANWVIENHDNLRIPDKFGPEMVSLITALKLMLPGIDVTYYGSEIGMADLYIRPDQIRDPNNAGGSHTDITRDPQRTPMQWDNTVNAGFTNASKPWLPVNPNYYKLNVETQKQIPTSPLNFYKKMVQLRKTDTVKYGDLQTYNISKSIYIVKRSLPYFESYIVVMNYGTETETVQLSKTIRNINETLYVYLGSENSAFNHGSTVSTVSTTDRPLRLRPQSVVVLTDKEIKANPTSSSGIRSAQILSTLIGLCCALWLKWFSF